MTLFFPLLLRKLIFLVGFNSNFYLFKSVIVGWRFRIKNIYFNIVIFYTNTLQANHFFVTENRKIEKF